MLLGQTDTAPRPWRTRWELMKDFLAGGAAIVIIAVGANMRCGIELIPAEQAPIVYLLVARLDAFGSTHSAPPCRGADEPSSGACGSKQPMASRRAG